MTPVFKWERQLGRYQSGEDCKVGKVIVATAHYSGFVSRGDDKVYVVGVLLPGIKSPTERYRTIEEAKARAEHAVSTWFRWVQE